MEKENIIKWGSIVLGIVFIFALLQWTGVWQYIKDFSNRVCIKSHEEQYLQAPMSVNVGGGKYGGGIGIPLGDVEVKIRTVCDEYQYPTK